MNNTYKILRLPTQIWLIWGLGLLLRCGMMMIVFWHPDIPRESDDYLQIAVTWLTNGAYPTTLFPPLYPLLCRLLLVLFAQQPRVVVMMIVLIQTLLGSLCILFTYIITTHLFRQSFYVPIIAAILVACDPLLLIYGVFLLTESLYTFLVLLAIMILSWIHTKKTHRFLWDLGCGLVVGCAALTRSVGTLVLIPFGILILGTQEKPYERVLRLAITIGGAFVLIGGWSWHNYLIFNRFSPSSSGSYNIAALWIGPAKSLVEGKTPETNLKIWEQELKDKIREEPSSNNGFVLSEAAAQVALHWASEHPMAVVKGFVRSQAIMLVGPSISRYAEVLNLPEHELSYQVLKIGLSGIRGILELLCGIGFFSLLSHKIKPHLQLWSLSLCILIGLHMVAAGAGGYSRFIAPVVPYINIFAAFGVGKIAAMIATAADSLQSLYR